jgi:hypothetical protein
MGVAESGGGRVSSGMFAFAAGFFLQLSRKENPHD